MKKAKRKKGRTFKDELSIYLSIKGLDIILLLESGEEIMLHKNRQLIDDIIITAEKGRKERRIPLSSVKAVDMYAA